MAILIDPCRLVSLYGQRRSTAKLKSGRRGSEKENGHPGVAVSDALAVKAASDQ
jgi:hypothetical protein